MWKDAYAEDKRFNQNRNAALKQALSEKIAQERQARDQFSAMWKDAYAEDKRFNRERAADAKAAAKAIQEANKQAFASSPQGIYESAGVKSPQDRIASINSIKSAQKQLHDEFKSGAITLGQYNYTQDELQKKMNLATEGNVRARGALHQLTARFASLAFELTGAIYGLTAIAGILGGPALFGISYLKSIEDARIGLTGTLIAMGKFPEGADKFSIAMSTANKAIKELEVQSIRFGVPLDEIVNVMRAVTASGLGAGMTIEEIGKASSIAAVAVKALGLDARQVVQETRDLFMGGIQAASSTLATSLGLKIQILRKLKKTHEKG